METLTQLLLGLLPPLEETSEHTSAIAFIAQWLGLLRWIVPDSAFLAYGIGLSVRLGVAIWRTVVRLRDMLPFI